MLVLSFGCYLKKVDLSLTLSDVRGSVQILALSSHLSTPKTRHSPHENYTFKISKVRTITSQGLASQHIKLVALGSI